MDFASLGVGIGALAAKVIGWARQTASFVREITETTREIGEAFQAVRQAVTQGKALVVRTQPLPKVNEVVPSSKDLYADRNAETEQNSREGGKAIEVELVSYRTALEKQQRFNQDEHSRLRLDLQLAELTLAVQHSSRHVNNILTHLANLRVHSAGLHTVSNLLVSLDSMVDQFSERLTALEKPRSRKNKKQSKSPKREIAKTKPRSLLFQTGQALSAQAKAFSDACQLLDGDCADFIAVIDSQIGRADHLKQVFNSANLPALRWIDGTLVPSLERLRLHVESARLKLKSIPRLPKSVSKEIDASPEYEEIAF